MPPSDDHSGESDSLERLSLIDILSDEPTDEPTIERVVVGKPPPPLPPRPASVSPSATPRPPVVGRSVSTPPPPVVRTTPGGATLTPSMGPPVSTPIPPTVPAGNLPLGLPPPAIVAPPSVPPAPVTPLPPSVRPRAPSLVPPRLGGVGGALHTLPLSSPQPLSATALVTPAEVTAASRTELRRRAEKLQASEPAGAARVLVELAVIEERLGEDLPAARASSEQARALSSGLGAALTRRRRLLGERGEALIGALDDELRAGGQDGSRAALLAERGWVCHELGRLAEARVTFGESLRLDPAQSSAQRGLLATLEDEAISGGKAAASELEAHLGRLAEAAATGDDPDGAGARLGAWLLVERAALLDQRLGQPEQALGALQRAVALQPGPGPVREALTRFLISHRHEALLVASLEAEAQLEPDDERAARKLLTAARLRSERLRQPTEALPLLTASLDRAPMRGPTRRRSLDELARLHEENGRLAEASAARTLLLPHATDDQARTQEHIRLAELLVAQSRLAEAVVHERHALDLAPTDRSTRERLEGLLEQLGHHNERRALWLEVASSDQPTEQRVEALLRAAAIAVYPLRLTNEALTHLRAAWALAPGHGRVFDALSALLAPPAREADEARGVRARLDLYAEAARTADDPARRIALLEKIAFIHEDELGQPAAAAEELARVLALDPQRRSAILALERVASRSDNPTLLVRALVLEADVTSEPALRRRLLLRAAEVTRDRLHDRAAAFALLERAEAVEPSHPQALEARATHARLAGRFDEARKALLSLISQHSRAGRTDDVVALWLEIARLDEHQRKNPRDAVASYRQAARVQPEHPRPPREIARLLRHLGDARALVDAWLELAVAALTNDEQARFLAAAAELQEMALNDDEGALRTLQRATSLLTDLTALTPLFEASERILIRRAMTTELVALYRRWLEAAPGEVETRRLRLALATLVQDTQRTEAIALLDQVLESSPTLLPALRQLRHLRRRERDWTGLAAVLTAEASVLPPGLSRRGALRELASLEPHQPAPVTLAAYERITHETPDDTAALDASLRLATALRPVPHVRLRAALVLRRERTADPLDRALLHLEEALLLEHEGSSDLAALSAHRAALDLYPQSLAAARGLARLATRIGPQARPDLVHAEVALGELVDTPAEQATHLVRAADLTRGLPGRSPLDLYELALVRDPDCTPAATSLVLLLAKQPARLVERLALALDRAQSPAQLLLLGAEIARHVLALALSGADAPLSLGLAAIERALPHARDSAPLAMLRARLERTAQLWPEAHATLERLLASGVDRETRLAAQLELFDLYRGPLADSDRALASLRAVLTLDPHHRPALESLLALGRERHDSAMVIEALRRLLDDTADPSTRVDLALLLSDAYRDAGNGTGQIGALIDAILAVPSEPRPWEALAHLYQPSPADPHEDPLARTLRMNRDQATAYAAALMRLLATARERDLTPLPRWATTLGLLESLVIQRHDDALAHLRLATSLPSSGHAEQAALALGLERAGRNVEAARTLRALLSDDTGLADLPAPRDALATLETSLAKEGRAEEQLVVEEVRACLGDMPADWIAAVRARRLPSSALPPGALAGPDLARPLPSSRLSPMVAVSAALAPIVGKILGFDAASLSLSSRDRIGPRDGHPVRTLADRIARVFAVESFDLYLASSWTAPPRAYPASTPLLVAPASFADRPELEQTAALTAVFFRIATGLTYLDDLSTEALDGLLVASLAAVEPTMLSLLTPARAAASQPFLNPVTRAIGRRQRKQLEEAAPSIPTSFDTAAFAQALRHGEHRAAYLLTGSPVATLDALRRTVRDKFAPTQNPLALDVLRYALSETSLAERRRTGVTWTERRSLS